MAAENRGACIGAGGGKNRPAAILGAYGGFRPEREAKGRGKAFRA